MQPDRVSGPAPLATDRRRLLMGAGLVAAAGVAASCGQQTAVADPAAAALAPDQLARLNLRENPFGPSPKAMEAIRQHATEAHRYAGDEKKALTRFIAEQNGVEPEQVLLGNGSKPILSATGAYFARKGGDLITAKTTYKVLYESAQAFGANLVQTPLTPEWDWDFEGMAKTLTPAACGVYLANPETTTGRAVNPEALAAFTIEAAKLAPVFVDEAYIDMQDGYQANSMMKLVREGHNVIVSRTLSKLHGLAGQRIGYAVGPVGHLKAVQALLTDHVNRAGLVAGLASLQDVEFQSTMRTRLARGRSKLETVMAGHSLRFVPGSSYNGILIDFGRPKNEIAPGLLAEGVLVGGGSSAPRPDDPLPTWMSICVGTDAEIARLDTALGKVLRA